MNRSPEAVLDQLYAKLNALEAPALRELFWPWASLIRAVEPQSPLTFDAWASGLPSVFTEHEEVELSRQFQLHGLAARATSRFRIRHRKSGATLREGTNLLTFTQRAGEWRIAAVAWVVD
jgi:hypothetical protein